MTRLFHWPTIATRLALLAAVLLAVQLALGLAARSIVLHSGEGAVGARVESSRARVSFLKRRLTLDDLRLERAEGTSQTVVELDRCTLDLAAKPLLYKRAVVQCGTATGIRHRPVPSDRTSTAAAARSRSIASGALLDEAAAERASQWLARVDALFERDLVAQFESVRRTEELCARWPSKSAALDERLAALKKRATALQQEVRTAQSNPLRHVEFFNHLPDALSALDRDFAQLAADTQMLADSIDADRRAIVAARARDEQFAAQQLRLEPLDSKALTAYLLHDELDKPVEDVIGWLHWIRQIVPAGRSTGRHSSRGTNVVFTGCRPAPGLVIRDLQLQGTARLAGQPVEFVGTLSDFSTAPSRHPKPIQLRLKSIRSLPLQLQATVDRTGPIARDELLLDCGGLVLPESKLGQDDALSLSLAPSTGSLSVSAAVKGEQLSGDIQIVQRQLEMLPTLHGELRNLPLAAPLEESLKGIDALALRISLSGTLQEPKCSLWSNLGAAVAESIGRAFERAAQQHAHSLLAKAQQQVDERLAQVERQSAEQQAKLLAQSAEVTAELAQTAREHSPARRLSHEQVGGRLPAGSLFR